MFNSSPNLALTSATLSRRLFFAILLVLLLINPVRAEPPKKLVLLSQGPDGHPPQTHEYHAGQRILRLCLQKVPGLEVAIVNADEPWRDGPEVLAKADGAVLFLSEGAKWLQRDPKRLAAFQKLAERKGALAGIHWAIGTRDAKYIDPFLRLLGGCHGGPDRKFQILSTDVKPVDPKHPITAGIKPFKVREEFYYRLKVVKPALNWQPIVQAAIDGQQETVAWAWERPDGGRSFGFSGLHFHENWQLPEYRRLVVQGVLWTLRLPIPVEGLPVRVSEKDLQVK